MKRLFLLFTALAATFATSVAAEPREERVRFARGATSTELRGEVRGYDYVDYLVGARAGQRLSIELTRVRGPAYFLVRAPGSEENLFDNPISGQRYETILPVTGDYRVRVLMMRNAARRNQRAVYRLNVRIR